MKPRSPLGTPICPYCGHLVTSGKVTLLRNGGYAHAACKHEKERERREYREGARARDKVREFEKNWDEAAAKGHEAVAELLKGVKTDA